MRDFIAKFITKADNQMDIREFFSSEEVPPPPCSCDENATRKAGEEYYLKHSSNRESVLISSFSSSGKTPIQPSFQKCLESEGKFALENVTFATRGEEYSYSPVHRMES